MTQLLQGTLTNPAGSFSEVRLGVVPNSRSEDVLGLGLRDDSGHHVEDGLVMIALIQLLLMLAAHCLLLRRCCLIV